MNINFTPNNNLNFRALIPSKDYKGVVLKLTKNDKTEITRLEKIIAQHEIDQMKISKLLKKTNVSSQKDNYTCTLLNIDLKIEILREMIKQIKINRLNKQKAKLAKAQAKKLDTLA